MILDTFKLHSATFQVSYPDAFDVWDRAGEIASKLTKIWPDLTLNKAQPDKQIFKGHNVTIQTGLNTSVISLLGSKSLDQSNLKLIQETFELWRSTLGLSNVNRISTLANYSKNFPSIREANSELIALNMAKWPNQKIFDQPMEAELNGLELFYRFEDEASFSTLRIKAQQTKYNVNLEETIIDEPNIEKIDNQILIIFDRGMLGTVNAEKFRVDAWIKGFQHVLRRDIEKITSAQL